MKVRGMPRTSTAVRRGQSPTIFAMTGIDRRTNTKEQSPCSLRPLCELIKSLGKPTEIPRSGCEHPAWNDAGREAPSACPVRDKKITYSFLTENQNKLMRLIGHERMWIAKREVVDICIVPDPIAAEAQLRDGRHRIDHIRMQHVVMGGCRL